MSIPIQSSSASTAILISLVSTGAISLYTAIPILFGHEIELVCATILSSLEEIQLETRH
ncbi:MAG: hypothetical protein ACLRQF_23715 [Thomasclavelia ramosa]